MLPLVGAAVAVPLVRRWLRRRARAREADRSATAVAALCGAVVGELRAGREPGQALLVALLPVAGLGLGAALGAEPLRVLLHTPGGLACLAVGAFLEAAGLYWACRIVRGGEAA